MSPARIRRHSSDFLANLNLQYAPIQSVWVVGRQCSRHHRQKHHWNDLSMHCQPHPSFSYQGKLVNPSARRQSASVRHCVKTLACRFLHQRQPHRQQLSLPSFNYQDLGLPLDLELFVLDRLRHLYHTSPNQLSAFKSKMIVVPL